MNTAMTKAGRVYHVYRREPRKGARWRKVGEAPSRAAALALVDRSGDWRITDCENPHSSEGRKCESKR